MSTQIRKLLYLLLFTFTLTGCNYIHVIAPAGNFLGDGAGAYEKFYGIPYAMPPTGALRWKPPVTRPYLGEYDARYKRPNCPQGPGMTGVFITSENCLFLNIFRPVNRPSPRPVMVFFHGGGYDIGSGSEIQYEGRRLAERGVILVAINYRLGVLGHLSLSELSAEGLANEGVLHSGNYAFLDQVKALEWVQTNISAFGGDPNNVTIFGESAGGMSACFHLGSPLSQGLFHKAIIQSGNCEFVTPSLAESEATGQNFSETIMGCPKAFPLGPPTGSGSTLDCMRSKSVSQIYGTIKAAAPNANILNFNPIIPFTAINDGYFHDQPTAIDNLIVNGDPSVPVIIGVNKNEGSMFYSFSVPAIQTNAQFHAKLDELYDEPELTTVKGLYPVENYSKAINAYADFDGDKLLGCSARWTADVLADEGHPVYFYELGQITSHSMDFITKLFTGGTGPDLGVFHSHDIAYVFGMPSVVGDAWHAGGRHTMYMIQEFWTSFAENGVPTSTFADRLGGPTTWPTYDSTTRTYYSLKEAANTSTQLKQAKCDFFEANKDLNFFNP